MLKGPSHSDVVYLLCNKEDPPQGDCTGIGQLHKVKLQLKKTQVGIMPHDLFFVVVVEAPFFLFYYSQPMAHWRNMLFIEI